MSTGQGPNVDPEQRDPNGRFPSLAGDGVIPESQEFEGHVRASDTWAAWFPLLAGKEFGEARLESVAAATDDDRARLTQVLVGAMVERWAAFEWVRLVPLVAADSLVLESSLSTRAVNVLMRRGLSSLQMVVQLSTNDLYKMPGAGAQTVREIAEWVLLETIGCALRGESAGVPQEPWSEDLSPAAPSQRTVPSRPGQINADFAKIASWMTMRGLGTSPLLSHEDYAPEEVKAARQRILEATAEEVLPESPEPVAMLEEQLEELSPDAVQVARLRTFADEPATLQFIGDRIGVSRERVRQLEQRVFSSLSSLLTADGGLQSFAEGVAQRIGALLPLEQVLKDFPSLETKVAPVGQPLWRVLDRLDSTYEIEFEWCAGPTVSSVRDATRSRLQDLSDDYGLFAIDRIGELDLVVSDDENPPWLLDWLDFCDLPIVNGFVLSRTNSLADRAAAALAMAGQPMTLEEFPTFVIDGHSLRSLGNAMGSDGRFHRIDRNRWALSEWGLSEYRGIAAAIAQEVNENGGQIPLDVLTHRLVRKFSVAETSVRAYASAPPFVVEQGVVRRGARGRDSSSRKSWRKTRRVYRRADGMAMRITVTSDHMRGSGSSCPIGLARELGLSQGESSHFAADAGAVGVYWTGMQPTLGSISPLLQKTDAEVGDTLIVLFQPDGRVDAWVADTDGLPASEHLLRLIARDSSSQDVAPLSGALALAIGMPPESSSADLVAALESRGDDDVAELFLSLRETQSDRAEETATVVHVEDILDLLS